MLNVNTDEALKAINTGENILLTGHAGSGKTYLIKEFAKKSKLNVALTATTGIAALNLGGETVHRLLGIGITSRPEYAEPIIRKWNSYKNSSKPWEKAKWKLLQSLDCLIIDEASMLRRDQFELIEFVLSSVLDNGKPFGGIQIILVGDFFQLPPVVTVYDQKQYPDLKEPFCFQSFLWKYAKFYNLNLITNYRQSDEKFLDILNNIRIGNTNDEINSVMKSRLDKKLDFDVKPIKLFPYKIDVKNENIKCLKQIKETKYKSEAEYTGKKIHIEALKNDSQADEILYFCKGAQIMMITNDPKKDWVNGSMGTVIDIDPVLIKLANGKVISPDKFVWEKVVYKLLNNKWSKEVIATMKQYPFKLSYSSTIHKSQGLTLDCVELDLANSFAPGQAYVALSRVKDISGLSLKSWSPDVVSTDPKILEFYNIGKSK